MLLLAGLALGLGASAMELASPMITRVVLESLEDPGGSIVEPVLWLAALLVGGAVLGWLQWVLLGRLSERVVHSARAGMIRRYLRGRILPLLRRPSGELVTRVTSDSLLLREAASSSLVELANGIVMLGGTLVLMAVLDIPLVLTTVATIAVIAVVIAALMPAIARSQERAQASLGALGGTLDGSLRAIKTIKVAGAEERQEAALLEHATQARDHGIAVVRREALVWTIASAGIQAAIILVLGVGAWRIALGEMTVPTLVAFLLYAFGLLGPILDISTSLTTLQSGIAAAGRIREIEDIGLERSVPHGEVVPARGHDAAPLLTLDRVSARYAPNGPAVLADVSLTIPRTGHYAIVGPSGAGKTSIFSLLLDFLQPESGRILLEDMPYERLSPAQIRSRFAYVEQETPTLPGTLRDNVTFAAPAATDEQVRRALDEVALSHLVDDLPEGLDTPLTDTNVSGGQRQRIALARAFLARPAVLLLDEATAQLDGRSEAIITSAIRDYARHAVVLTVAHRLSTVVHAAGITVLDGGSVVGHGTHDELLVSSPLYRSLVSALSVSAEPGTGRAHPTANLREGA